MLLCLGDDGVLISVGLWSIFRWSSKVLASVAPSFGITGSSREHYKNRFRLIWKAPRVPNRILTIDIVSFEPPYLLAFSCISLITKQVEATSNNPEMFLGPFQAAHLESFRWNILNSSIHANLVHIKRFFLYLVILGHRITNNGDSRHRLLSSRPFDGLPFWDHRYVVG